MGFVHETIGIKNLQAKRSELIEALVDSGAQFTMAPAPLLKRLGITPERRETFQLANGKKTSLRVGSAHVSLMGRSAPTAILFGPKGCEPLLGIITLEALELVVDPVRKKLRRTRMLMV
jgi:predicted aspartyl protease